MLNGRISRELGFDKTFVPPGPGDEGIAVGCALYGLQVRHHTVMSLMNAVSQQRSKMASLSLFLFFSIGTHSKK